MSKRIEVRFETITPQRAKELLANNFHNRNLSRPRVHYYAELMKRGEWDGENGESIKIAEDGTLVDGQHRLAAIVESGATTVMMVVYNVSMESQETLDQGRKEITVRRSQTTRLHQYHLSGSARQGSGALGKRLSGKSVLQGSDHQRSHLPGMHQLHRIQ